MSKCWLEHAINSEKKQTLSWS